MKIDFAETIREVLDDRHPVTIIGLGTLVLKQNAAEFGVNRETLNPPKVSLDFKDQISDNLYLYDWLSKKYDLNEDEVKLVHGQFCQNVLNRLVNYGQVNIPGVATFSQDSGSKQVKCEGDEDFLSLFYKGLPVIPVEIFEQFHTEAQNLAPVTLIASSDSIVPIADSVISNENDPHPDNEQTDSINIAEEASKDLSSSDESLVEMEEGTASNQESEPLSLNERLAQQIKAEESDQNTGEGIESTNAVAEDNTIKYVQKPDDSNYNWVWLILLALLSLFIMWFFMCNKKDSLKDVNAAKSNSGIVNDQVLDSSAAQDSLDVDTLSKSMLDSSNPNPEYCIIVTGVFKKARYILKMQDLLSRDGFDVYKEVNGDLTRVGIKFSCRDVNLEDYIQGIRRTYAPKAWYLDPELYVEYEN